MSALKIQYDRGGIYLPALKLWLDPREPQLGSDRVFVSHAHSDHTGIHREIILTAPTSKLMQARTPGKWVEHVLPYRQPATFEANGHVYTVTLLPAGHVMGSAMLFLEAGGSSLLYTGDFKLRHGISSEPCDPRPAEFLIMETTYGRPEYHFPKASVVMDSVVRFCREALDNDEVPVLLGYSLGKSQELLCSLADAGLPIMLHAQIHKMTEIYGSFGQKFPAYEKYEASSAKGKVLICPPHLGNSAMLKSIGPIRKAVLTGWALDPGCRYRYHVDAAFALSDHADFPELLELVKKVRPRKVYTVHGFTVDFAATLRGIGFQAEALGQDEQLALPFAQEVRESGLPSPTLAAPAPEPVQSLHEAAGPPSETATGNRFHLFAQTCLEIGRTPKKLEKTGLLAAYLRSLDQDSLAPVNSWFTGNPFPPAQNKVLRLGWAIIRDALCAVGGLGQSEFGQVYLKFSDLGETTADILQRRTAPAATLTISDVQNLFEHVYGARGPLSKVPLLAAALKRCTPLEGKYLVKILTGELRIGLKEGLVEEAIATAFLVPVEEVKTANLLLGNICETTLLAKRNALKCASLVPFRPVKFMLASPEDTAEEIWKRVESWAAGPQNATGLSGPEPAAWIEDKYDGIRCQLHKVADRVAFYSRDLKEITATFLEVADSLRKVEGDFVLDGEILAMRDDAALPFAELQKRLGRREGDLFLGTEIPVRFMAFDLLWFQGESLLEKPLQERRALLEKMGAFQMSRILFARSAAEIEAAFTAARGRGNEGLMIKDPASVYSPGRRGMSWLKLKKAHASLDCVVVGAEYGHGKRNAVLSDYTFAVRDDQSGQLKTIGKAYSGLTDSEIAELTGHFLKTQIRQHGRYLEVEPDTVLEIAFDAIQPSDRHTSGLAMRFPRILRIRRDKSLSDIDTVATARTLVRSSSEAQSPPRQRSSLGQET